MYYGYDTGDSQLDFIERMEDKICRLRRHQ